VLLRIEEKELIMRLDGGPDSPFISQEEAVKW
jgi:hypothetical protein